MPFGEVIEVNGAEVQIINDGTTERYHDLANVDTCDVEGRTLINIFRGQPRLQPIEIRMMERHPIGSQAFYPLKLHDYLIVVSDTANRPKPGDLHAFKATGVQGVNYHKNIWHHPLLVLVPDHDFLVIDRGGPGENLEECLFDEAQGFASLNPNK
jgi:ureidoglycolate lyase